jgi:hypothetical protein
MSTDTVAVLVPAPLYQRLARLAALTNRPLESLVAQTLSAGLPPLPDDLPPTMRDALQALEQFDDTALEQVARERMSEAQVEQFEELRERQRAEVITTSEQQTLDALMHDADLRMLRKAYAAVLLKLRGQPVPTLTELDA